MNKDQFKGRAKEISGKIKKNVGDATDNPDTEAEGAGEEVEGKVQKTFGDLKNKIGNAIDKG